MGLFSLAMRSTFPLMAGGLAYLAVILVSCGPGGNQPMAGGGIGGTGSLISLTRGAITSTAGLSVSGNEYDTTNANIQFNGQDGASLTSLKKGMVVLVKGTKTEGYGPSQTNNRFADTIVYKDTVAGPVQWVRADGFRMEVLGQKVLIDDNTIVDSNIGDIRNLHHGDRVRVSGFIKSQGVILAAHVQRQGETSDYHVTGFVKNHNADTKQFEIGHLTIRYVMADIAGLPSPVSNTWDTRLVNVTGTTISYAGLMLHSGTLIASKVEPETLGVDPTISIDDADVEGCVTKILGEGNFVLENIHVQTTPGTIFQGGMMEDIALRTKLDVEGHLINGVLLATTVAFTDRSELESNVATVTPHNQTLTLVGFPGLTVKVNSHTRFQNQRNADGLKDIRAGDHIRIRGYRATNNTVMAFKVYPSAPSTQVLLQGEVDSVNNPHLVILGALLDTTPITNQQFQDAYGRSIGRATFFNDVSVGTEVQLRGSLLGDAINWDAVELIH